MYTRIYVYTYIYSICREGRRLSLGKPNSSQFGGGDTAGFALAVAGTYNLFIYHTCIIFMYIYLYIYIYVYIDIDICACMYIYIRSVWRRRNSWFRTCSRRYLLYLHFLHVFIYICNK